MISIIADPIVALDMYETAFTSYLAPVLAVKTANSIELRFDGGFRDEMMVAGMTIGADGTIIAGTITDIVEYRDGTKIFAIGGLNFPAVDLATLVETGSYDEILERIFSENMRIFGSSLDDRLYGSEGNDMIWGGIGDDEIEGLGGNDFLYGGIGNDVIVGGNGTDTAIFDSYFNNNVTRIDDGSIRIVGSEGNDVAEGIEYFQFTDGMFVTDADSTGAQLMRLYDTILDRAPDAVGLEFYVDRIEDRGVSLAAIASEIAGSAEFQTATGGLNNGRFVDYVYQKALGRAADASGKAFYTQLLDSGLSRGVFVADLSESAEHRDLTAEMVAKGYFSVDDSYQAVTLFYDSFMGRRPDAGGLQYYAGRVKSGTMSLSQVADDFAGSSEFKAAIQGKSNAEIVDYVYRNTLDRAPDAGGAAYYTDLLNKGFAPAAFVAEVSLSQEHYNLMSGTIINGIDLI